MPSARPARVAAATLLAVASLGRAPAALSAPVEVYRTGDFCPQDRPADGAPLTEAQAIGRARALLPADFCGPSWFVSGCDASTEHLRDQWRVYVHQYKERGGAHDWRGLTHSYVILDRVGNCLANIPGTELGAPR